MKRAIIALGAVVFVWVGNAGIAVGKVVYVDGRASGADNGTCWADAYIFLQDGLADANESEKPVEVWVAQGIYPPDRSAAEPNGTGDRMATFRLINAVTIQGGYAGFGEADPNARDIELYETVLRGDLDENDIDVNDPADLLDEPTRGENSYNVVTGSGTDVTAILDGFTITGGNADGYYSNRDGGGMYNYSGNPTLTNCTFSNNSAKYKGGGMYNESGSPTVNDCTFIGNLASEYMNGHGGGMYNWHSSPALTNCTFSGNYAGGSGGGIDNSDSNPTLTNCEFTDNRAERGGGMYNSYSNPTLTNCTFSGNSAPSGGGMYNATSSGPTLISCLFSGNRAIEAGGGVTNYTMVEGATLINCTFSGNSAGTVGGGVHNLIENESRLTNCILWGNSDAGGMDESAQIDGGIPDVDYCCIQGWTGSLGGTGNTGGDPMFLDTDGADNVLSTADDNLRLLPGSPCIDAGINSTVPPLPLTDRDGNSRILNEIVDIGAYEGAKQGFLLSAESITIPEGETATFTVALAMNPLETVLVSVFRQSGDPDITVESGEILAFDSSNYRQPQTVTVAAAEDGEYFHGTALIWVSAPGCFTAGVTATETDNDEVIFVDARARGANDGTSWANAFTDLHEALSIAAISTEVVCEVHVAQGVYRPAGPGGDRTAAFELIDGVAVRGGYAGLGEADPNARDIELYETVLSGDLNSDDGLNFVNNSENSYHVVVSDEAGGTDIAGAEDMLDGFTITGGNANGSGWYRCGGGMYCDSDARVTNCTLQGNWADNGGGMCCGPTWCCVTSPTLDNCTFIGNLAEDGGGMFISDSDPALTNCVFIGNSASNDGGAVMYCMDSIPKMNNCLFSGNQAAHDGGGIFLMFAFNIHITNSTFGYNSAGNVGGGIYQSEASSTSQIDNCILWGNTDIGGADEAAQVYSYHGNLWANYSCIQGWTGSLGGTGNIGADPNGTAVHF